MTKLTIEALREIANGNLGAAREIMDKEVIKEKELDKMIDKTNYKTVEEILNEDKELLYLTNAKKLECLALTEFSKIIEKNGATILSCSPIAIKSEEDDEINTIGNWIKYTYDFYHQYYIQFDGNPFFPQYGSISYNSDKKHYTTGLVDLQLLDDLNAYDCSTENVQNLVVNLHKAEKDLKKYSFKFSQAYVGHRDNFNQKIYK